METDNGINRDGQLGPVYRDAPPYGSPPPVPPEKGGPTRGKILGAILIVLLLIGVLFAAGFVIDRWLFSEKKLSGEDFRLEDSESYDEALYDIRRHYYGDYTEEEITAEANTAVDEARAEGVEDADELEEIGITALVEGLKDDHSQYLNPEDNRRLNEDISGSFFGVGLMLRDVDGRPKVVSVIDDSPSDRAGVKKEDVIMSVDGEDTMDVPLDVVVSQMRGKEGTEVELKVKREGEPDELTFNIIREKIEIPDVEYEILDGKYGYVHVYTFNQGTGEKVRDAVRDLSDQGVEGFILDLRSNPGGLLDEAVNVGSVFIDDGVIVSYATKGEKEVDEKAGGDAETDLPLVVLTNEGSASSSEIIAGAIRDHDRGLLIGGKTFGKGSVQKIYDLDNGGAVKLTIALYFLPGGDNVDGDGIEPDVPIEFEDDVEQEEKLQLDKAKEVLQELIDGTRTVSVLLRPAA